MIGFKRTGFDFDFWEDVLLEAKIFVWRIISSLPIFQTIGFLDLSIKKH